MPAGNWLILDYIIKKLSLSLVIENIITIKAMACQKNVFLLLELKYVL